MKRVLVVEDEDNLRKSLAQYLESEGFEIIQSSNGLSGQKKLTEEVFDAMVLDLKMPGMNGLALLNWVQEQGPDVPAIMMSAFGEVEDAVAAMKAGAVDYIVKPFDPEELVIRLNKTIKEYKLLKQVKRGEEGSPQFVFSESGPLKELWRLMQKAAPTESNILITGESGTGKEVIARQVHILSKRKEGPFWPINIGGVPESLLESELFGYEKGAFTGADKKKQGLFELAEGGTLFLDEIGDMPHHLQVKLLRVIQERKIQRLGSTGHVPINVRIIAATNKNLEDKVEKGSFREDLFYRLNVIRLELPPLRKRIEDIPLLIGHFLEANQKRMGLSQLDIQTEAINVLQTYSFPGNIRELENIIERATILCDHNIITAKDLSISEGIQDNSESTIKQGTLKDLEKEAIIQSLHRNDGKRSKAAEELGITRRTLLNKIKEYELNL
ncbi:sigma-54-dependent transcriptional regulator [Spirochaeta cellobiosiphila]|uniref:sigma-54-dependent transcriptional regulator n=1 Tax=Spirochaeta cellobiosiphila TaxID=504483 RepID=UPI000413F807|nr:sigma-54 dependent transcriptional regulator [Spirochaeta cellobiosiphila]